MSSEKVCFSNDQEKAIQAGNANYLISAGAGSGKTAVLTERIYRLAKKEKTLDKFLVLTFTNLAASEMKERVRGKLLDDQETIYLASEVDNSHIETFDSFSLFLVKKYFYRLNIVRSPNIVDASILTIKRKKVLDEICEKMYQNHDSAFEKLIYAYSIKSDESIKSFIISILLESDKKADKYLFLENLKNNFYDERIVEKAIKVLEKEIRENISFVIKNARELEDLDDANNIINYMDNLLEAEDYDALYKLLTTAKFPTKPRRETSDVEFRKTIAAFFNNNIKIKDKGYGNSDDIKRIYLDLKPFAYKIIDIAIAVEKELDEYKKQFNAYTFGDISRKVLELLKDDNIVKEISNQFEYIMVDEYQDTNDIQESVINRIARENVYMVGDVKQSIYRFRGADCHIFQEKYEKYKLGKGGKEIDLNTSYRSRKEVVDFVNELFGQVMTKEVNAIDYSNGHHFGFGRTSYEVNKPNCSYQPEVYNYSYEKSVEATPKEIRIIASDIVKRIRTGFKVVDKNGPRNCTYKDFAIIIDRSTAFDDYRKFFSEAGIPLKVEAKESFINSDIVAMVKSLVKLLYYSLQEDYDVEYKHAFFSVARSFLLEYNDDVLYQIHTTDSYLQDDLAIKIEDMKESLRYSSIKNVLITLYEAFNIYDSISKITNFYSNAHRIESFIKIAENMDSLGYTLKDFVDYFDDLASLDIDMEYKDSDTQENSVTLLTIHGSKGLEYGIVYLPGLIKEFNRPETKSSFMLSDSYGLVIPSTKEADYSSPFIHLIKEEVKKADFEEKIRLLYVAVTRTKEKLIFVNGSKDNESKVIKPSDSKSMKDILNISNVLSSHNYDGQYDENVVHTGNNEEEKVVEKVVLKTIDVPCQELEKKRASKELNEDEEIDESLLDYGTEIHALLENMDLENDDLSYIKDERKRQIVRNVKESWLFKGVKNSQVRHEFRFYDEANNVNGYIDALIIREDVIDIVDFKLRNIDDGEYDKQLRTYKAYVKTITNLPIRMFLLAALTGEIREVKDE